MTSSSAIGLLSTCALCWIYAKGLRLAGDRVLLSFGCWILKIGFAELAHATMQERFSDKRNRLRVLSALRRFVCDNMLHSRSGSSDWSPKYPTVRSCVLIALTATIGHPVMSICRDCWNAEQPATKARKIAHCIHGWYVVYCHTYAACSDCLFFAQFEQFGWLPLAQRMPVTAAIARSTIRVHPKSKLTRVETLKRREALKERFDDECVAVKAHLWCANFNACYHGHDAQCHALRTRGPCISIGNFAGLV